MILLTILTMIVCYIIGAGVTYGYGKHRWPDMERVTYRTDDGDRRAWASLFWPLYWMFIWTFTKSKEVTFSNIEKHAARKIAQNKSRIADLLATRKELEESYNELDRAEVDLEQEITKIK